MAKRPAAKSKPTPPREIEVRAPAAEPMPTPVPFASILGQDMAIARLTEAMRSGRIHHAWVFHGPAGVGKFTAALAFAALLLDPTTQPGITGEIVSDPDSPTRRLLDAGAHPDLHVVTKELAKFHSDPDVRKLKLTTIPVDVVREFLIAPGNRAASVAARSLAGKVFIVDEAELMGAAAQNALLKFLEEPPPRSIVMLVTTSEEHLLPTIRSRCQRVYFGPLPPDAMNRWLTAAGLQGSSGDMAWLRTFAMGSPGVAAGAVAAGLPAWRAALGPMLEDAAAGRYAPALGPTMAELVDAWAKARVESGDEGSKSAATRAGADWMLRLLASHARDVARRAATRHVAVRWADALRDAEAHLDANLTPLFVFERLACDLALGESVGAS
ncbi:MAG: hypothetical protein HBSAPP03_03730 [Phycisphaerae bacterium]|nr:MAG: hypothetical protein HBSAPP03_03730 [Phycisphaerae bacterium]